MTPPRHTEIMTCPECQGAGRYTVLTRNGRASMACSLCIMTGRLVGQQIAWRKVGQQFRERRVELGVTLRDWARCKGLDVETVSNAERGVIDPEVLRKASEKGKP